MKKMLAMILVGVTSTFLQINVMAADNAAESTATTDQTQASDVQSTDTSAADNTSDTSVASSDTPTEPPAKAMPEILGKSVDLVSLRGDNDVADESEEFANHRIMVVDGGIDVTFSDQPPMIPHNIDKDRISLQENTCLKCHSKVDSKVENAPKPTPSHFRDREGKKQKKIVAGRYFCTQCHAPQANKKPLVKNQFKPEE